MAGASPGARAGVTAAAARSEAARRFFDAEAERIARLCHAMAERFAAGGRLIAAGETPSARSDARHVAVEFVHPVIVGKRALPAIGLAGEGGPIAAQLALTVEPGDIVMLFDGAPATVSAAPVAGSSASNAIAMSSGSSTSSAWRASGPPSRERPIAGSARLPTITGCTNSTATWRTSDRAAGEFPSAISRPPREKRSAMRWQSRAMRSASASKNILFASPRRSTRSPSGCRATSGTASLTPAPPFAPRGGLASRAIARRLRRWRR